MLVAGATNGKDFRTAAQPEVRAAFGPVGFQRLHKKNAAAPQKAWRLERNKHKAKDDSEPELLPSELLFEVHVEMDQARHREMGDESPFRWYAHGQCAPVDKAADIGPSPSIPSWLVAREDQTESQGMYRLTILATFDRHARDAVVAAWCCRLWGELVAREETLLPKKDDSESPAVTPF